MSESIKNIFLNHLGHLKEDICGSSKKNQSETNVMEFNSDFFGTTSVYPNNENDINQSVFNVRKHSKYFSAPLWSHKRRYLKFIQENSGRKESYYVQ